MKLDYKTTEIFRDITKDIVVDPKAKFVHLFSKHTTCGLRIIENEIGIVRDAERFMEKLAPKDGFYTHHLMEFRDVPEDEPRNGHSHMRFFLYNTSELIPIKDGKLDLGKWQSVFLVDLDYGRDREIQYNFIK